MPTTNKTKQNNYSFVPELYSTVITDEMIAERERNRLLELSRKAQSGQNLYDMKGAPSKDTRTHAQRNEDYFHPVKGAIERGKSEWRNDKHVAQALAKTVGASAALATGAAYTTPVVTTMSGLGTNLMAGAIGTIGYAGLEGRMPTFEEQGIGAAMEMGLPLAFKGLSKSVPIIERGKDYVSDFITNKTPLRNVHKLNPNAFKPSSDNLYRGLGESGFKDAFESGVLRPRPVELRDIGKDIVTDSGKTFRLKGKTFDKTYYSPDFKTADRYGNGYIAEVPKNSATFNNRYSAGKDWSMHTTEQIPIDKANILKKDWLMGYKKINAPNIYKGLIPAAGLYGLYGLTQSKK